MLSVVLAWPVLRPLQLDAKFSVSELECTSFWHCKSLPARCPKCTKNHLVARRSSAQTFPGSTLYSDTPLGVILSMLTGLREGRKHRMIV